MKVTSLFLALLCIFGLTACSSGADTSGPAETEIIGIEDTLTAENFEFSILSVTAADTLTNALGVEYAAEEGNDLLFIVFNAKNTSDDTQNVMNTNFNGAVDGVKVIPQSAVGEINGYMPLVGAVSSGTEMSGYAVWEVPSDWSKLEFSYIDALTGSESDSFTIYADDLTA